MHSEIEIQSLLVFAEAVDRLVAQKPTLLCGENKDREEVRWGSKLMEAVEVREGERGREKTIVMDCLRERVGESGSERDSGGR